MDVRNLRLIEPNETMYEQFMAFCEDFRFNNWQYINGIGPMLQATKLDEIRSKEEFLEGITRCRDCRLGKNLPKDWVACSTYWLVDGAENIHAMANLRHELSDALETEGGHVGYSVKPSSRGQGVATQLLHVIKLIAQNKGIDNLLMICNKNNAPSRRVIEKSGGIKSEEYISGITGNMVEKFWIKL